MPLVQPPIDTLRGYGVFTKIITQGVKYEQKPVHAFVRASFSGQDGLRVGFAVSRGIRKAAHRNLFKRLMREAFRNQRDGFLRHCAPGMLLEIVFLYTGDAKLPPKLVRFESIQKSLNALSSSIRDAKGKAS